MRCLLEDRSPAYRARRKYALTCNCWPCATAREELSGARSEQFAAAREVGYALRGAKATPQARAAAKLQLYIDQAAAHDAKVQRAQVQPKRHLRRSDEVDPIAVERAVGGDPPLVMTQGEMIAAIEALRAWRYSANQIAVTLRCSRRKVERYTARARQERS